MLGKVYFRRVGTAPERQGLLAAAGRKEKEEKKGKKRKENKLLFLDAVCTIWIIKVGARTSAMHKTSLDLSLKAVENKEM